MAELFLAEDTEARRKVVIKRILPYLSEEAEFVQMFLDEARIAAQLHHGNIVQVHELGNMAGSIFIVMEYVSGADLRRVLQEEAKQKGQVPLGVAAWVAAQVCAGLHHAHNSRGVDGRLMELVHRDVSPQNVMVGFDGRVKLVDFGIAKAGALMERSKPGIIKGKFLYLSPEQVAQQRVDQRADLFAMGTLIFEVTTGKSPFSRSTTEAIIYAIKQEEPPSLASLRPGYPPELARIVNKCLEKDRNDRYQDADELRRDLETFVRVAAPTTQQQVATYLCQLFNEPLEEPDERTVVHLPGEPLPELSSVGRPVGAEEPASTEPSVAAGRAPPPAALLRPPSAGTPRPPSQPGTPRMTGHGTPRPPSQPGAPRMTGHATPRPLPPARRPTREDVSAVDSPTLTTSGEALTQVPPQEDVPSPALAAPPERRPAAKGYRAAGEPSAGSAAAEPSETGEGTAPTSDLRPNAPLRERYGDGASPVMSVGRPSAPHDSVTPEPPTFPAPPSRPEDEEEGELSAPSGSLALALRERLALLRQSRFALAMLVLLTTLAGATVAFLLWPEPAAAPSVEPLARQPRLAPAQPAVAHPQAPTPLPEPTPRGAPAGEEDPAPVLPVRAPEPEPEARAMVVFRAPPKTVISRGGERFTPGKAYPFSPGTVLLQYRCPGRHGPANLPVRVEKPGKDPQTVTLRCR